MLPNLGEALYRLLEDFAGPRGLTNKARRRLGLWVDPGWQQRAWCVGSDGDAWFPETPSRPDPFVLRVCAGCPVRVSCAVSAVLHDEVGVWGGTRRGQRLHARARLLAGDPVPDVLVELLTSPPADTEYALPDPTPAAAEPEPDLARVEGWPEAS